MAWKFGYKCLLHKRYVAIMLYILSLLLIYITLLKQLPQNADMVEMADTEDSKSFEYISYGFKSHYLQQPRLVSIIYI